MLAKLTAKHYSAKGMLNAAIKRPVMALGYGYWPTTQASPLDREPRRLNAQSAIKINRRRPLTVEMIHKISEAWKTPADLLVRPSRVVA
jgi:HTH-type transcriptional regulator/antitoxin HigA